MQNKEKIIIVVLIVIIILGFITLIWYVQEGYKYRTNFIHSFYELKIYTNGTLDDIELMIPVPADNAILENMDIHETEYGQMIKLNLTNYEKTWHYDFQLLESEFSTYENETIWIYANVTNISEPIYFTLIKEDHYDTFSILETQIDYEGVVAESFPEGFGTYQENYEYRESVKVELLPGWNQYPLINGTYIQYAD